MELEEVYRRSNIEYRSCPFEAVTGRNHERVCHVCLLGGCRDLITLGLDDEGRALPPAARPRCGAKNRKGSHCKLPVAPGKRRCRYHGGASTGPKTAQGRAKIAEAQRKRWARQG
ncbi:HGGxSTG domain-containing protein [Pseudophaeobacter profundi]|uniref:HGGxSTG domain-containing protein n=1 Tax=Pseudophaeobacter profundi TaxID=3034152 RepID=UPI002432795A|nr:HGGxSTG domain-containing protein [Pseudophaeobacter profundi]